MCTSTNTQRYIKYKSILSRIWLESGSAMYSTDKQHVIPQVKVNRLMSVSSRCQTPLSHLDMSHLDVCLLSYLDMCLQTGLCLGAAAALTHTGTFDFRTAAPSQDTIRSTAHTARTIA